jgi:hypothetical protein
MATKETPRRRITIKSSSNAISTIAGKRLEVRGELFFARPQPFLITGDFFLLFMYVIQHGFICRPSDSTVSEDAGIELKAVATSALAVRCSNHSARSHPQLG